MLDEIVTDVAIKETPTRKRRSKAQAVVESAPILSTSVAVADAPSGPEVDAQFFVMEALRSAGLMRHVAEVHPTVEPDGTIRRVEFRAASGTQFRVPQSGLAAWVTFVGSLREFPAFLATISTIITVDEQKS